jgi:hypothetical protein
VAGVTVAAVLVPIARLADRMRTDVDADQELFALGASRKETIACLYSHETTNAKDLSRRRRDDGGGTRRIREHSLTHAAERAAKEVMVTSADDHEVCLHLCGAVEEHLPRPAFFDDCVEVGTGVGQRSAPILHQGRRSLVRAVVQA